MGKVWNGDVTTLSEKIDSVASTGFGVRGDFMYETKGGVAVAFPLTRVVETRGDHQPRIYLNLNKSF